MQNAINTAGTSDVVLCQGAQFSVTDQITLLANTTIYTEGKPANSSLWARIYYVPGTGLVGGDGHKAIIDAYGKSGVKISYLTIDGSSTSINVEPNLNSLKKERTSLAVGGNGTIVDHVRVINTIGMVAISAADDPNCYGLQITNSFIGFSGFYGTINGLGQWADGIGVYCQNARILNNEIRDVTDGGITFYGGALTQISSNWIANSGRNAISGIVAAGARSKIWTTDFTGSTFSNNIIETAAAYHFHVAISAGSRMWCNKSDPDIKGDCNYLGTMSFISNTGSGNFGYGIVNAGMNNVTFVGNNLTMTQWNNPVWTGALAKCARTATVTNWYVVESGSSNAPNSQLGVVQRPDLTGCAWYQL